LKFSIITPSFNRAEMLDTCIQSVLSQDYPNFEHIIVDGGSTDGTLDLLKGYSHIQLLNGPDHGMYDALNKGIAASTGDIVTFLNTDDLYGEGILCPVAEMFGNNSILAVAGKALVFSVTENGEKILSRYSPSDVDLMECSTIGSNYFNAWFFRRSVFDKIGAFDAKYRIAGDREFMLRFALSGLEYKAIDKIAYQYLQHAGSLTFDDDINKREQTAYEHLEMTNYYLRDPRVDEKTRFLLKQLRSRTTLEMSIRYLKVRNFPKVFKYIRVGMYGDMLWLPLFIKTVFSRYE
jgi:glycosyltransferase involved in cell wall biosynthesis